MTKTQIKQRLEYLRGELRAERISLGEIAELQSLAEHIDNSDVELLEAAGVPEHDMDTADDNTWACWTLSREYPREGFYLLDESGFRIGLTYGAQAGRLAARAPELLAALRAVTTATTDEAMRAALDAARRLVAAIDGDEARARDGGN